RAVPDSRACAAWIAGVLKREGLSQEAAARQLGVSVKTVSRWVGGETEPRLRELPRIHKGFRHAPLPARAGGPTPTQAAAPPPLPIPACASVARLCLGVSHPPRSASSVRAR